MSDKTYNKPPWIKTGRRTRAMRSAKKQRNMELREKRRAEEWYDRKWRNLSKEEQIKFVEGILEHDRKHPVQAKPYHIKSVLYEDGTSPSMAFFLGGKRVNPKVMLEHLKKSAEEGNTPVQDPMEFGEMANWRPMDGTPGLKRQRAEYISDLSNSIVQFEDGSGFSSASAPPNDIHFGAENQVFALTYWIDEGVNIDDINDVSEALELYLSLSDDIAEMEDLELQKHPRYELAKKLQSDLSYRLDELQTALPDITTDIEMDAEYDAWRSAFADGASATMLHKYDRNWMSKVNNPRSTYIRSYWNDAEPEFMEELRSAEGDYLDRMSFRASYAKPLAVVAGLAAALLAYRKL